MGNMQIKEVSKWGITTLEKMAAIEVPLKQEPKRGSAETYEKLAQQAELQHKSRTTKQIAYETLPLEEGFGLYKLPEPSEHDMFFDFEGDPFVGNTGLEYLFGWIYKNEYHDLWAHNDAEEKKALEIFFDTVTEIRKKDSKM